jgi:hypothetical protein
MEALMMLTASLLSPGRPVRLEVASPDFFATPLKKLTVEQNAGTGRTYVLKGGRIVAVAKSAEARP